MEADRTSTFIAIVVLVGVDLTALEDEQHAPLCYLYLLLRVCEVYFFYVFNSDRIDCTALLTFTVLDEM